MMGFFLITSYSQEGKVLLRRTWMEESDKLFRLNPIAFNSFKFEALLI